MFLPLHFIEPFARGFLIGARQCRGARAFEAQAHNLGNQFAAFIKQKDVAAQRFGSFARMQLHMTPKLLHAIAINFHVIEAHGHINFGFLRRLLFIFNRRA